MNSDIIQLEELRRTLDNDDLDFMEKMEIKDDILRLERYLNLKSIIDLDIEDCENCSA